MGVFKNIKDGWSNYLKFFYSGNVSSDILKLAEKRANICKICPSLKESKVMSVITTLMPDGSQNTRL